jgi:hypothetical protein
MPLDRGMPPTLWAPPAPQLIHGPRMLIVEVDGHDSLAAEESMPIPGHNLAGTLAGGSSPFGRTTGADLQRQRR